MDYAAAYRLGRSDSIGSYSAYLELNQPSAFDLLRTSIIRSIRTRDFDHQGFLEKRYDGSNAVQTESYSNPKFSVIEVKNLDLKENESDLSDLEQSVELKQSRQIRRKVPQNSNCIDPFNIKNCVNIKSDNRSNSSGSKGNATTIDNNHHRKLDKNSIKLARRKFSNTIFEDCSTYNITSSNVELDEDNPNASTESPRLSKSDQINVVADDIPLSANKEIPSFTRSDVIHAQNPDEHTSLCDTFFPHVNDYDSQSSTVSNFELGSLVEKSATDGANSDAGEASAGTAKRRHSKRHRKRSRRKSKAKKPFIYECSKCGVSYVIPTKGMNKVACCLHCDLWVPVEPVFVRREKTTWNTCQIC